jgi:hypothetical protein
MIAPPEPGYVRANRAVKATDPDPARTAIDWYRAQGWEALDDDALEFETGGAYVMVYVWVRSRNYAEQQARREAAKAARS